MQATKTELLDKHKLIHAQRRLRAMNHPIRRALITYIAEKGTTAVNPMVEDFNQDQSWISQQLGILRRAGFIQSKQVGKEVHYWINYDELFHFNKSVRNFLNPKS